MLTSVFYTSKNVHKIKVKIYIEHFENDWSPHSKPTSFLQTNNDVNCVCWFKRAVVSHLLASSASASSSLCLTTTAYYTLDLSSPPRHPQPATRLLCSCATIKWNTLSSNERCICNTYGMCRMLLFINYSEVNCPENWTES